MTTTEKEQRLRAAFGKRIARTEFNGFYVVEIETTDENERAFIASFQQEDDRPRRFFCLAMRGGMRGAFVVYEWTSADDIGGRTSVPDALAAWNPTSLPHSCWTSLLEHDLTTSRGMHAAMRARHPSANWQD